MRPGDFSPGNSGYICAICAIWGGFNEAGGFLPRKQTGAPRVVGLNDRTKASMRPGDFSPGNPLCFVDRQITDASMRPGDFSPGNPRCRRSRRRVRDASMRPGDFSPGNWAGCDGAAISRTELQ